MVSKNQVYVAVGLILSTMLFQWEHSAPFAIWTWLSQPPSIWGKPSISGLKMGKWVRLTNKKYLIAFWNDLQPYE